MSAPSLLFGTGDWELAGWYLPLAWPPIGAALFASNDRAWGGTAAVLQQFGVGYYQGRLTLVSCGGADLMSDILTIGKWYWLRAQRVEGVLRLFVDEVLAGSYTDTRPWNLALIGRTGWDTPEKVLAGTLANWSARTSGISTVPGSIPPAPAPVAEWYPNNLQAGLLDAVFGGGQVRFTADGFAFADSPDWARTQPGLYSAARVSHSATMPPFSLPRPSVTQMARDVEFGGAGVLEGTTTLAGQPDVPTKARVSILRLRDKELARQVWSDPATGKWRVSGLDTDRTRYVALAEYPGNPDDPATEGYLRPVAGVSPLTGGAS